MSIKNLVGPVLVGLLLVPLVPGTATAAERGDLQRIKRPRDFEAHWGNHLALSAELPVAGSHGSYDGYCAGWPLPATTWHFKPGKNPLQLVGHTYESVTPLPWAHNMRTHIGGSLLTIEDDRHGSLSILPCASKAVEFFDTGKISNTTCPGTPILPAA